MNSQEAQQAQTIAEIRERWVDCPMAKDMDLEDIAFAKIDRGELLEIVDSKSQKMQTNAQTITELAQKLAEQAKEMEKLNRRGRLLQDIVDCALGINSAKKMCGKGPIDPNIDYFAKQLSDYDAEQQAAKQEKP